MVMIGDKIADISRFWAGPAHDPPDTGEWLDKLVWCPPITRTPWWP